MHPTTSLLKHICTFKRQNNFSCPLEAYLKAADAHIPSILPPPALPQPQINSVLVKRKANHILWVCFRRPDQCCFDIPATRVPISTNGSISGRPPLQMEWGSWLLNQHFPSCWQYRVMRRFKESGEKGETGGRGRWHLSNRSGQEDCAGVHLPNQLTANCSYKDATVSARLAVPRLYNESHGYPPLPGGELGQEKLRASPQGGSPGLTRGRRHGRGLGRAALRQAHGRLPPHIPAAEEQEGGSTPGWHFCELPIRQPSRKP